MERLTTLAQWRAFTEEQRRSGRTVGFVPTMGALHDGHGSLVRRAVADGTVALVSIFVNPRQFNDASDLAAYPRDEARDLALCESWGAAAVVTPSVEEMWPDYPRATATTVSVAGITERFEGAGRPGHFDGVASVVTKLFAITGVANAYFGEKDFQQLAMVRQLNRDLALGMTIVGCPIARDHDGLALSSRNVRLSEPGRAVALAFSSALRAVEGSSLDATQARATMQQILNAAGVEIAYAELVHPDTLEPVEADFTGTARALLAGLVDGVRLLDNAEVLITARKGA